MTNLSGTVSVIATVTNTVVATVAVLRKPKGIDDMLEALPALLNNHPLLRYLIVGDGPHRTALQAKAAALGIHESVHFAG